MKDKLEEFFQQHKDDFDHHELPAHSWASVDKQLRARPKSRRKAYYAIAASLLFLVGSFVWFTRSNMQRTTQPGDTEVTIAPEMKEAEAYYTSLVETKRAELDQLTKDYPQISKDFDVEIDTLHALYGQLKMEYKMSDGNDAVLQAMIANLQTQVQLLGKELQVLQDITQKQNKKGNNSRVM